MNGWGTAALVVGSALGGGLLGLGIGAFFVTRWLAKAFER